MPSAPVPTGTRFVYHWLLYKAAEGFQRDNPCSDLVAQVNRINLT